MYFENLKEWSIAFEECRQLLEYYIIKMNVSEFCDDHTTQNIWKKPWRGFTTRIETVWQELVQKKILEVL